MRNISGFRISSSILRHFPIIGITLLIAILAALGDSADAGSAKCKPADNRSSVKGGDECLVIKTFDSLVISKRPILIVFLHGDKSSGGSINWEYGYVETFTDQSTVSVALVRPGYSDKNGIRSTGNHFQRRDNYTAHNIDAAAQAIQALKTHHNAAKLVIIGYSGGAAYAGVIIGRHPDLADAAILLACPCNVPAWRRSRDRQEWSRSLSPHSYADRVPTTTRVIALTGSEDRNTKEFLAKDYIKSLEIRGVKAEYRQLYRATHQQDVNGRRIVNSLEMTIAIRELLKDCCGDAAESATGSIQFDGAWEGPMRCGSCINCLGPLEKNVAISIEQGRFDIIPDSTYLGKGVIDDQGNMRIHWTPSGWQKAKKFSFDGTYDGKIFRLKGERGPRICTIELSRAASPVEAGK